MLRRWHLVVIGMAVVLSSSFIAGPAQGRPLAPHVVTSLSGRLVSRVWDAIQRHRSETRTWVETSEGPVQVPERFLGDVHDGDTVRISVSAPASATTRSQVASAVRDGSADILSVASISVAAPVIGLRKVILIPAYVGATVPTMPTTADFQAAVQRANAYWTDASGGAISLSMERVTGWTRLPDGTNCDNVASSAIEAFAKQVAGSSADDGHHSIIMYLGGGFSCWYDGVADTPGNMLWLIGTLGLDVTAHELGHNYGLLHSGTLRCYTNSNHETAAVYTQWCDQAVYEEYYDIMGNGVGYPSASHLANLGLLPSSDEVRLRSSGTVTLKPVGSKQGLRLIRVSDGPHELLIEYRRPIGLDSYIGTRPLGEPGDGVIVRELIGSTEYAIDLDPLTFPWQPALLPGMTLTTPVAGATIHVVSADAASATVEVNLPSDTTAPEIFLYPPDDLFGNPVQLEWTITEGQSGVASQVILVDGKVSSVSVGATATTASVRLDSGTHTLQIRATDKAGNTGFSNTMDFEVAGPPIVTSVAATLRAATVTKKSVPVTVAWKVDSFWGLAGQRLTRSPKRSSRPAVAARSYPTVASASSKGVNNKWKLVAEDHEGSVGSGLSTTTKFVIKTSTPTAGFTKGWTNKRSKSYLGRTERRTSTAGATWTGKLTGREIGLVAAKGKGRGVMQVYIDGVLVASPDLLASSTKYRQLVFTRAWSTSGSHAIKIVCLATAGRPLCALDGYVLKR